jgi:hypothetical protein
MASLITSNKNVVLVNNDVIVNSNSLPLRNMNTKVRYLDESLWIMWPSFGLKLASTVVTDRLHLQIILLTTAFCLVVLSWRILAAWKKSVFMHKVDLPRRSDLLLPASVLVDHKESLIQLPWRRASTLYSQEQIAFMGGCHPLMLPS